MSTSIRVENLSKSFQIGAKLQNYATLRDEIAERFQSFIRGGAAKAKHEEFLALNNVSFDVNQGEMVGIVGKNGAGKSTLLKLLSRISQPTKGRILVRGRMASLLEVGTGFHPELTGRENIFLNGSILGMSRSEIRSKFDQIVQFSGISQFIDTPVKRYSSGMYVRLAFAVAAHLDPDILVVDEVLAVGDAEFQRKCTDTMKDVSSGNRTVLFVSHNLQLVRTLCSRVILIENGRIAMDGKTEEVLNHYIRSMQKPTDLTQVSIKDRNRRTSGEVRITAISAYNEKNEETWFHKTNDTVTFRLTCKAEKTVPSLGVYLLLRSALNGEEISTILETVADGVVNAGEEISFEIKFPRIALRPGDYLLYIAVGNKEGGNWHDIVDENVSLPLLSVSSEEKHLHRRLGFFDMPVEVRKLMPERYVRRA